VSTRDVVSRFGAGVEYLISCGIVEAYLETSCWISLITLSGAVEEIRRSNRPWRIFITLCVFVSGTSLLRPTLGCLRKKVIRDVFNDGPVFRARVWMGCLGQSPLDVRYIQNNRGSIQCLLAPTPGCSPCCRSFYIPVVVAGKGPFWRPWADCSSRNLRIVSA
jgi:hypothetical protein